MINKPKIKTILDLTQFNLEKEKYLQALRDLRDVTGDTVEIVTDDTTEPLPNPVK